MYQIRSSKMKKSFIFVLTLCLLSFSALTAFGQDVQTRGSVRGTVTDPGGAVVAGATVTVTGPTGERTTTTNGDGTYEITNLAPGQYTVRITNPGFKTVSSNATVFVGRATSVDSALEVGEASAVVEVTAGAGVDQASTAVGSNLNDQLFENIPVARGVSGLFYLAPGATNGLGGGSDNPSISGGSALDNLYVADGVNITNSAFGGIGTFSRVYGALGTGINTSFVKEVQVKTGGFEPQYGQSTGGIVNIITQSGGNEFHGAFYGYARPNRFEGTYRQRDATSTNKVGELLAREGYDVGVDIGGPIVKDKVFFFGSFNPSIRRDIVIGAQGSQLRTLLGEHVQRYRTYNYAGKLDYNISPNHSLTFSIFGDPTKTNKSSFSTLNIDSTVAFSQLDYGSRNLSLRYNGTWSPTWTVSASYGQNQNKFDETGFDNFNQIVDRTGIPTSTGATRGTFTAIGLGFVEPTHGATHSFDVNTNKSFSFWGQHSLGIGFQFQRGFYSGTRDRSGPKFAIPATNATGVPLTALGVPANAIGQQTNVAWSLRVVSDTNPATCPLCPVFFVPGATNIGLGAGGRRVYLRQDRGEYGDTDFETSSDYHAAYVQDTWRFNRFVTGLLGIRWEQEKVIGSPDPTTGDRFHYSFTGQYAPRLGVTVDPTGKGRMKAYYNFGRFFEYLPLDVAERSLSLEQDFTAGRFAPQFTTCATTVSATDRCAVINAQGTVNPIVDPLHTLTGATGGTGSAFSVFSQGGVPIIPGTKLGFLDEHMVGFETQLFNNWVFSARYIRRDLKRAVEDLAIASPEASIAGLPFFAYFIGNPSTALDAAINPIPHLFTPGATPPAACGGASAPFVIDPVEDPRSPHAVLGAICYEPNPLAGGFGTDGIPDGFVDPVRKYRALEIELNKRFSNNWQLLANWRIGSLKGNYEGHLRNDNGQTDPGISSLFDFTAGEFNLLGDQFAVGPLNSDRRHVINVFGSYSFSKDGFVGALNGLNLGFNFRSESGIPISEYLAHPAYANAGEIPVGGRGKIGRTPWNSRLDLHADYPWNFSENMRLKFIADVFNVTNTRKVLRFQEFREATIDVLNPDFLQPRTFYAPFNLRLGLRFEF
jgi:hypothetical protein